MQQRTYLGAFFAFSSCLSCQLVELPRTLPRTLLHAARVHVLYNARCAAAQGSWRLPNERKPYILALQVPAPRHTSASAPTLGPRATPPKRTTPVRVRTRCRTRDAVLVRGRRGGGRLDPVRPPAPPSPQCCPVELMRRGGHVQPPPRAYLVKMPLKNGR